MHLNRLPDTESRLYHEAHITVEPNDNYRYESFANFAKAYGWRASKFEHDDVDGIEGKWFLSAKQKSSGQLAAEMREMVRMLRECNCTVLRAKIEDTLFDTKYGDEL